VTDRQTDGRADGHWATGSTRYAYRRRAVKTGGQCWDERQLQTQKQFSGGINPTTFEQ